MTRMGLLFAGAAALVCAGCTGQMAARHMGGSTTVDLPKCAKLINVTWKDESLWYLTRPMTATDRAESYRFKESSSFGVFEGDVTLKEHRDETCT